MKIIRIIKNMSIVSMIILISFLFIGCEIKDVEKNELKTYSNANYTIQYPSNWLESEDIKKAFGGNSVVFSKEDNQFSLEITSGRIYPYTVSEENYIEELLTDIGEDTNVEDYIIDGNKGYKIKTEENNEPITLYLVQKKDMIFEMHFVCQANDHNDCETSMEQIVKSFEFNDFESLSSPIDNWNKYSIENLEIYYPDNSDIYESIGEWAKTRVEAFNYITEYLDVQWKYEPIKIFVFNSKEHGEQYGLFLGFAISEYSEIFTEDTQSPGHELAHCISYWINNGERIDSDLIEEGLATYLNMSGNDYHRLTADILQGKNYSIKLLGDDFRKNKEAYTFGASFVKYLIDEYSLELFKEFYSQNKYNEEESFIKFYKKEGNMLVNEWIEYLKTY